MVVVVVVVVVVGIVVVCVVVVVVIVGGGGGGVIVLAVSFCCCHSNFVVAMIFVQHLHKKLVPSYSHQIADLNCHLFFALAETTALFSR